MVFCHVKLAQHTETNISDFEAGVSQLDEVLECYHVSGEFDYLIKSYGRRTWTPLGFL